MMMTMTQKSLQQVTTDSAVDTTLTLVAEMVGLSRDTVTKIVEAVYTDVAPAMYDLAGRSVMAHLEKLREEKRIA